VPTPLELKLDMLKIVGSLDLNQGHLVIDEYVPFSFRVYDEPLPAPHVWLVGNLKTSLLEVKIDAYSAAVMASILVLCNKTVEGNPPSSYQRAEVLPGLPRVTLDGFGENRLIEENRDFELIQSGNCFFVIFDKAPAAKRCYRADRAAFFEGNNGELCGIGFYDLTAAELAKFRHHFRL
jgi:hypothetical protein